MAESGRGARAKPWGGRASSACPGRCVVQRGPAGRPLAPPPSLLMERDGRCRAEAPEMPDWVSPWSQTPSASPSRTLPLPRSPCPPELAGFSRHFEFSANFMPLVRAAAWAAITARAGGLSLPVCQPAALAAGRAGKAPGSPGQMLPKAGLCPGALLSILLQAGKHRRDGESLPWAPGAVNNERGIHKQLHSN